MAYYTTVWFNDTGNSTPQVHIYSMDFFLMYLEACIVGIYSVALYKSCTHTCDTGFLFGTCYEKYCHTLTLNGISHIFNIWFTSIIVVLCKV